MASTAPAFCVALLLLVVSVAGVRAVPQDSGTSTCSTDLFRLLPCLPFIEGSAAVPADTCCANLGSMVHDEPQCLCQALSNPSTAPVAVNMTRVMAMPRLCRLDLPPATGACAGLLPHGTSPPAPPARAVTPRPSANSTAPATLTPATPTPTPTTPRMIPSPSVSSQMPRYSRGSKVIADGFSVALGFVALVSVLAF
ncbi:hypothetical protein BDA96_06G119500 [Sorghum bicolor]|uniref:Bifunctional inhibitor/plant lipid transfer protein/seed storage helical domain-containing protein n=1 Tax=Sorghum bicolor TaxID=4558 RepID=A0A921UCT9_SORBI|nr:non-specific lipid-transfer protein C6 isoform X2 [Sorghum bicolor]KAG0526135.1 hypothetical protein BDA96_06G119500 [Sorghum bicolor]|eukprot:XP_021318140.1 non-specific lipid-transfer protein C6 isoform X2 [Sorghum bicolor]